MSEMNSQPMQAAGQVPAAPAGPGLAAVPAPDVAAPTRTVPWGAVVLFVVLAYGLSWLVALPLWLRDPADQGLGAQLLAQAIGVGMMFTPALATLVVVFLAKSPRTERARFLGLWPIRPAKRFVWMMVLGFVVPLALVVLSLGIAVVCGWFTLDLEHLSAFTAMLSAQGVDIADATPLLWIQLAMIPVGAILNMIPAFGEEFGWRGWLLPTLRPLGTWPALVVSGAIWGVWHAPLTLLGHNFGLLDWRGVIVMTVGCIGWGVVFGWLRLRSASVWPAVFGHATLNAAAGIFVLLADAQHEPQMWLVNPLGAAGWIAAGVLIVGLLVTGQFKKQPELGVLGQKPQTPFRP